MKKNSKTKSLLVILIIIGFFVLIPIISFAVTPTTTPPTTNLVNPIGTTNIQVFIGRLIRFAIGLSGTAALLMFVWGGFLWLTSAGSSDKIKKGKDTLLWATLGLAFIFASYIIANFVINLVTGQS